MQASAQPAPVSTKKLWAGIVISALPALFLLYDGVMKLVKPSNVVETTVRLGYPTHVRAGDGPFPILFPVIVGALLWGGLSLRDERISKHLQSGAQTVSISKGTLWAGRVVSAIPVLMLIFASATPKFLKPADVLEQFARLGYSENVILGIGILELACTIVYIIPRVSVLGAILLTGYLGGAVATHVRVGDPLFNVITPAVLGALIWGGLYLRDVRLRALLPLRS